MLPPPSAIDENSAFIGINRDPRNVMEHFGRYLGEFLSCRGEPERFRKLISDMDLTEIPKDRGALFVTPHYGNWELGALSVGHALGGISVVIRTTGNRMLDPYIQRARGSNQLIDVENGVRPVIKTLQSGGGVAAAIDEPQSSGTEVVFFGKKILMADALFRIARRTGAAIIPTRCRRNSDGKIEITAETPVETEQDVASRFESWIREDPDQWVLMRPLWGHVPFK